MGTPPNGHMGCGRLGRRLLLGRSVVKHLRMQTGSWFNARPFAWWVLAVCVVLVAACRPGGPVRPAASAADVAVESVPSSVKGVWDWDASFRTKDGDHRYEEEAWLLTVDGSKVTGRYRRQVTVIASGRKVFKCNGLVSYRQEAVYQVSGTVHEGHLVVVEQSVKVVPSPCDSGQRRLDRYKGKMVGGRLVLSWSSGHEVLHRRNLTGLWYGLSDKTLANGDTVRVQERWRILQKGDKVRGVRDRMDIRISNDQQRYRCNQRLEIVRMARWGFAGSVSKGRLLVTFGHPKARTSLCERRNLKLVGGSVVIGFDRDSLQLAEQNQTVKLVRQQGLSVGVLGGVVSKEGRPASDAGLALSDQGVQ